MIKKAIILAAVASLLLASPALAIQKKGSSGSKSNKVAQAQNKSSDSGEKGRNVTAPDNSKKPSSWRTPRETKRDNFIDENDDGLNDNIKKEPTVKVKKRERPQEKPKTKEPDRSDKNRRG